ncbi:MAG: hypothetical protein AB7T49_13190 [Oligoflexales bacterium]
MTRLSPKIFLLFAICVTSCKQKANDSDLSGVVVNKGALWPDRKAEVCWLTPGFEQEKQDIREAIDAEINARTTFTFFGWTECGDSNDGKLEVTIDPASHPNAIVGYYGGGEAEMFSYDFTNENFEGCVETPWICMHNTAVHEFGHVMGLFHEQDRHDSECEDSQVLDDPYRIPVGPYDADSIMNYCVDGYFERLLSLSEEDVQTVNYLYQQPFIVDASDFPSQMDLVAGRLTTFPLNLTGHPLDTSPVSIEALTDATRVGTAQDIKLKTLSIIIPEKAFSTLSFISTDEAKKEAESPSIKVAVAQREDLAFDFSLIETVLKNGSEACKVVKDVDGAKEVVFTANLESKQSCRRLCDAVLPVAFSDLEKATCEY